MVLIFNLVNGYHHIEVDEDSIQKWRLIISNIPRRMAEYLVEMEAIPGEWPCFDKDFENYFVSPCEWKPQAVAYILWKFLVYDFLGK